MSTHLNTHCYHNHFVVNSVSFKDGLKYRDNYETYARIRQVSDNLCAEYGLSVLEEKKCKKSKLEYSNFQKYETIKIGYVNIAKEEIDKAIEMAYSYADFEDILKQMEYELTYRARKLSVCRPPYKRNIRIERTFGEEYSIENIKHRIATTDRPRAPFLKETVRKYRGYNTNYRKRELIGKLKRLYLYYCYLLRIYPKTKYSKKVSSLLRADVKQMEQYTSEIRFLCSKNINTMKELLLYKNSIETEETELKCMRENLWNKYKRAKTDNEKQKLKDDSKELTHKIRLLQKEVIICSNIEENTLKMKENIKKLEENQNRKEKMKDDKFR